jgi:quinol monooxygenase YgiN
MTAYNVVRVRVKPGKDAEFIALQKNGMVRPAGMRKLDLVKTADRSYCLIGEWDDMSAIVAGRPSMIGNLDRMRPLLEDLGNGLGVTDPVSGEVVAKLL